MYSNNKSSGRQGTPTAVVKVLWLIWKKWKEHIFDYDDQKKGIENALEEQIVESPKFGSGYLDCSGPNDPMYVKIEKVYIKTRYN